MINGEATGCGFEKMQITFQRYDKGTIISRKRFDHGKAVDESIVNRSCMF
jgi:hypothetical protein